MPCKVLLPRCCFCVIALILTCALLVGLRSMVRGGLRSGVDSSCLLGQRRRVGCYRSRARVCPCASHVRDECAGGVLVWVRVCVWCVRRVPTPRAIPILRSS